jgi:hypothetical protein
LRPLWKFYHQNTKNHITLLAISNFLNRSVQ